MICKERLRWALSAAVAGVMWILPVQPVSEVLALRPGEVKTNPRPAAAPAISTPDLNSELDALEKFISDFSGLADNCAQLSRKTSLTRSEVDSANSIAIDLKSRLTQIQQAVRSGNNKLRAAGRLEQLDDQLAAISDARVRTVIHNLGGRRLLDDAASQLSDPATVSEILAPIELLRRKVTAQRSYDREGGALGLSVVPVAYRRVEPMTYHPIRCVLGALSYAWICSVYAETPTHMPPPGSRDDNRLNRLSLGLNKNCGSSETQ